ncbi:MAG TPA: hypothetical protein VMS56_05755 [Thermoanaerobaculia bacterium]|nr:hypothetical protein [Thermoanaerobaculia bacterium]
MPHALRRLAAALFWAASFCYAVMLFIAAMKLLRAIPAGDPLAIGRVTIEGVSKTKEYAAAALYYVLVPLLALALRRPLERFHDALRGAADREATRAGSAAIFALPFLLAPLILLTTGKELWGILLPPILAAAGPLFLGLAERKLWFRALLAPRLGAIHALLLAEGAAWVLFRYVATGKRIAHIPTLFLEIPFVAFFLALLWGGAVLIARAWSLARGGDSGEKLAAIALGCSPLLLLPLLALTAIPPAAGATALFALAAALALLLLARPVPRIDVASAPARRLLGWIVIPAMLFVVAWTSSAQAGGWFDLFHRGESLGPASDYLRGDVPYRDVFVLHGMLEDGLLDAWLMEGLGRGVWVSDARVLAMSALAVAALWLLGMVLFDSIPLALLVVALGSVTFVENPRALMQTLVAATLFAALRRGSLPRTLLAGALACAALFYSLDVGIYSIAGSVVTIAAWTLWSGGERRGRLAFTHLGSLLAGMALVAIPVLSWLAALGAFGAFVRTSFVEVPRFIDPVWSLPFPDLGGFFRSDLDLRSIAEFVLGERIRFVLNPLILGIGALVLAVRMRSRPGRLDLALLLLVAFGVVTQRSALGRADFPHQYFSAFLIAPLLVLLLLMLAREAASAWHREEGSTRALVVACAVVLVPLLGAALWMPDLLGTRLDLVTSWKARSEGRWHDPAAEAVRERVDAVVEAIDRLAPDGAPIFDFSNQPAFYFFADRPNPTRFHQVPILSPPRFQLEVIRALERTSPPVVIRRSPAGYDRFDAVFNDVRAQAVAAYLGDAYVHVRTVRGVELWSRRDDLPPLDPRVYRSAIRIPSTLSLAPPHRVVFPAVGSSVGAAGAIWVSDLIVQNPHDAPVELRLRYASNRGTRDRTLVVAPGELRRERDAPRSLFDLHDSVGALWVEVPSDRIPVLLVETRDVGRGGIATVTPPLGESSAAELGTRNDALILPALRGGGVIRVNLGAVNVGIVPLHLRISARAADGSAVGRVFDVGVFEEQAWVVVDAASHLGVALDGTVTVHMRVLRGKAVAYASIVDPIRGIQQFLPAVPSPGQ